MIFFVILPMTMKRFQIKPDNNQEYKIKNIIFTRQWMYNMSTYYKLRISLP